MDTDHKCTTTTKKLFSNFKINNTDDAADDDADADANDDKRTTKHIGLTNLFAINWQQVEQITMSTQSQIRYDFTKYFCFVLF